MAKSLYGWKLTSLWPGKIDSSLTSVAVWQRLQPIEVKSDLPLSSEVVPVVGAGGAESRMKSAKLVASLDICVPVPVRPPVVWLWMKLWSSGVGLASHDWMPPRSLGKSSLVTPCSTL